MIYKIDEVLELREEMQNLKKCSELHIPKDWRNFEFEKFLKIGMLRDVAKYELRIPVKEV